jgi:hypothetical protein
MNKANGKLVLELTSSGDMLGGIFPLEFKDRDGRYLPVYAGGIDAES